MKLPKISDKNLYLNTVKRNFPTTLLFFVGMFIAFDVSAVMVVSNIKDLSVRGYDYYDKYNYMVDIGGAYGVIAEIACVVCAVFAGCMAIRYLMNRQSAALFGSIPQTRVNQLVSSYFAGVTSFAIPYAVTVAIMILIFSVGKIGAAVCVCMPYIFMGVMWFFFFYTLVITVGMLCGMTSIQVLGVATTLAYLPSIVSMLVLFCNRFFENIDFEYYLTADLFIYLSPAVRFVTGFESGMKWYDITAYIIATVVLFISALLLYKSRDNSKAGQPIVFDKIIPVIKYLIMLLAALVGGIFFAEANYNSLLWLVVGCVLGIIVSYMLMNVILYKNARAFFAKPKGLAVFSAVFAAIFVLLAVDPVGLNEYTPDADDISYIRMHFSRTYSAKLTDRENIEAAYKIITDNKSDFNGYPDTESVEFNKYFSLYDKATVMTKWGLPYESSFFVRDPSLYRDEYLTLCNSDEIMDNLKNALEKHSLDVELYVKYDSAYEYQYMRLDKGAEVKRLCDIYFEESGGKLIHDDMGPIVASATAGDYTFPIYLNYTKSLEYLTSHYFYDNASGILPNRDNISSFLSGINSITVVDDGQTTVYSDRKDIERIYLSSVGFADLYGLPTFMADSKKMATAKTYALSDYDNVIEDYYEYYISFDLLLY